MQNIIASSMIGINYGSPAIPNNTVLPLISGTNQIGSTLITGNGSWDNPISSFAYQWQSNGVNVGTNSNSYVLVSGDLGHAITCIVTASNAAGANSAVTAITYAYPVGNNQLQTPAAENLQTPAAENLVTP